MIRGGGSGTCNYFPFSLIRYGEVGMHVMLLLRMMKTLTEAMVVLFVVILAFSITFLTMNPMKILPADPVFYLVSLLHF